MALSLIQLTIYPSYALVNWTLVYTKQATKDAKKIAASRLKDKAQKFQLLVVP
jgi:hypothetical protein